MMILAFVAVCFVGHTEQAEFDSNIASYVLALVKGDAASTKTIALRANVYDCRIGRKLGKDRIDSEIASFCFYYDRLCTEQDEHTRKLLSAKVWQSRIGRNMKDFRLYGELYRKYGCLTE
jgi:hypothetical protein